MGAVHSFSPPTYKQSDPLWGKEKFGFGERTFSQAGSLITSVSSMIAGTGSRINGEQSNPLTLNKYLLLNGGYVLKDNFVWGTIWRLGFRFQGKVRIAKEIVQEMKQGKFIILCVNEGEHFVLATGYKEDAFTVMDPGPQDKLTYSFKEVVYGAVFTH